MNHLKVPHVALKMETKSEVLSRSLETKVKSELLLFTTIEK
jgi:hypothetical protein